MSSHDCFLCHPDRRLVYTESPSFYVMVGLGPIIEGYSIMSTVTHIPSYFDLRGDLVQEYLDFRASTFERMADAYRRPVVTEHGRVPACDFYDDRPHQAHCYHAHQLLFPADVDLEPRLRAEYRNYVQTFSNFVAARDAMQATEDEYLYFENADGRCIVIPTPYKHIRQYFRLLVAEAVGHPERISWHSVPGWDMIEAGRARLKATE